MYFLQGLDAFGTWDAVHISGFVGEGLTHFRTYEQACAERQEWIVHSGINPDEIRVVHHDGPACRCPIETD